MSTFQADSSALSLRANFCWTFAGNAVNAACQWGVLAVLARMASPAAVGQFVLGLAITAPVMAIAMLQLRNLLVTDAVGQFQFADYFGLRLVSSLLGLVAIGVFVWLSNLEPQAATVVFLVGVAKCADSVSDILRGLFQRMERMDHSGKSLLLRGPAALLAMGLTMWWTESLPWAVAAMAGMWLITLVFYDLVTAARLIRSSASVQIGARLRPRFARTTILKLSWMALPLGVVMGILSLQTNVPRFLIHAFNGVEPLGYFGALAYPMVAATMIATAMGQAASPRLAKHFLDDLSAYRRLLARLVLMALGAGFCCVAIAWALGRQILTLLYGAGYAEYQPAFVLLAIATAVQLVATCGGYGLTAARYFRIQVLLVSVSCLVTIAAGLVFVPRFGVRGGAMAAIATSSAMLLLFFGAVAWAMHRRSGVNGEIASPQSDPTSIAVDVQV